MKTLLLFLFPCIALSQVADFQPSSDTLILNKGRAVSITITNLNGANVWVECSLSDTENFSYQGLSLDKIGLGEKRRIDIFCKKTLWIDTVLTVTLRTNSLFQHNGEFVAVIQGKASYLGVESVSRSLGATGEVWYGINGTLIDSTKTGVMFCRDGRKKIVVR